MDTIYKKIKYLYEGKYNKSNLELFKAILTDYQKYTNDLQLDNSFIGYEELFNTLHFEILNHNQNIELFYHLLEKYHYRFSHSILLFISSICNATYSNTENYFIECYKRSPFITDIKKEKDFYKIDLGKEKFLFQKAPLYFHELEYSSLEKLAQSQKLSDCCHDSTYEICKNLENSQAFTVLCPQAFLGQYYHSFSVYQNQCIDLNYNCVLEKEMYFSLLKPEVIEIIDHINLDKELKNYEYSSGKLLFSALDNQIRSRLNNKKRN